MPEILTKFKVQAPGGKATPAPPIGPVLGQHGVNIQDFVNRFNEMTKEMMGDVIPAEVTVYTDRSFSLVLKTPPAAELLKKAAGIAKGSGTPNTAKVGTVTQEQIKEIAERKLIDLSARDLDAAIKTIAGTARSMGITIK
ncbi:MAG: 50S ribosomal protein L11 [Candidatus Andersenbacteria bacterium RIFCSPHIGHO2_12_FULL_46_9]|nr:MAG: 50S ribosomal protein L11 [Parcubacteria group bacterium GW2011_GWA2_45_14]OGY34248.1 MAG: 50S ribosomal protein L11 [Candidatus Andersenbacteria bacterium RIFCSPHIGHO2_02_FULL_46_16]OGY38008.1 MAG: 50S ribosomal protein L11 [Candidatus Andersenbacteria bacterium RIFCSPLOWO2_02_FULL_46_11]OGY38499.1 MAG: 50S ribosomal protein L11 [Candidatus Andersenbacteria bacterium RIFCSPHIGHO2_12_FULL_46_9]OGY42189.1 MAG: 50S ribosomal protein L11 [Candidatus Andersenbacteria bacterium RIFCSPLOWO2_1